ncbi:hypothetical protein OROGR_026336 [Orobanche gracilis]
MMSSMLLRLFSPECSSPLLIPLLVQHYSITNYNETDEMSLTKEQREETMADTKPGGTFPDKYIKAYCAALLMRKRKQEEMMNRPELSTSERQVGMKSKRDEDYEGDEAEWEATLSITSGQTKQFKVDLLTKKLKLPMKRTTTSTRKNDDAPAASIYLCTSGGDGSGGGGDGSCTSIKMPTFLACRLELQKRHSIYKKCLTE